MAENSHATHGAGYERADVDSSAVLKFGLALLILCVVAGGLLYGLFKFFQSQESAATPTYPLNVDARRLPPEPRLEETPVLDLKAMRGAEDQLLNGYGWVDRKQGIVRIPISRAMDLLAQRGLPSRAQQPAPASTATVPTASGLGDKMQPPGGPLAGGLK
jgi:hypothetical protein